MKKSLVLETALWLILAAVPVVAQVVAQAAPDFSGRWILESTQQPAVDIPQALTISQSLVRTNVYGEPMMPFVKDITVVRELANGTRSETYQIGVEGGTVEGVVGRGAKPSSHYRVVFEGRALVIESGSNTGPTPESGQWTERREVWSLDPDGRLRVALTSRGSAGASRTVALVYRRR